MLGAGRTLGFQLADIGIHQLLEGARRELHLLFLTALVPGLGEAERWPGTELSLDLPPGLPALK